MGEETGETQIPRNREIPATMRVLARPGGRRRPRRMDTRTPVTVAIARFEDLVAYGLRALIAEDPALEVVAEDVPHGQLPRAFTAHEPQVAIVNFGSLSS